MGPKWLIGIIMLFLVCTLISNVIDKQDVYTAAQVASVQGMRTQQFTEAKEPDLGGVATTGENPFTVIDALWTALKLDYSFLYNVSYTTTQGECATISNARWLDSISACQIPNAGWTIWIIIVYGPIAAISFFLALTLWKAVTGRG